MLSFILSIIAGWLSLAVFFTVVREHANRIGSLTRTGMYIDKFNGINTIVGAIAIVLWVIVAHLES